MNNYELKRQEKIERLEDRATAARTESNAAYERAHSMADVIPFGQPILVGHHSEKSDRSYRGRIDNQYKKSFELSNKADYLEARAEAMKKNKAIFSDDPDAAEKLADKIARLEARQDLMVKVNKLVRKNDREALVDLGYSETAINNLFTPDFCGRVGYPDYSIKNNGANIRRLKSRVETIEIKQSQNSSEKVISGVRVFDNVDDNRLQLFFPGKPSEQVRQSLKSRGFRWSPTNGCWQAFRGNRATYNAEQILSALQ